MRTRRNGCSGTAGNGKIADALERVVKGNERAAAIVRRVRTFLRTDDGERVRADLNTLACEAIELTVPEFRRQRVSLTSDRAAQPLMVEVDPVSIRQVVVNLLQNALDAVNEATEEHLRWVRVRTRAIETDHEAELTVEDSGPGLPADERHHLFEPLVTARSGGTDLGLAIVRSLVEAHGGKVMAGDAGRERRAREAASADIDQRLERPTPREREVMEGILAGKLNKVIGYELDMSTRTVEVHRGRILEKLGARNAPEMVRLVLAGRHYHDWSPPEDTTGSGR